VVADALARNFEASPVEDVEVLCATLLGSLPFIYSSLKEHKDGDSYFSGYFEEDRGQNARGENFPSPQGNVVVFPKGLAETQMGTSRYVKVNGTEILQ